VNGMILIFISILELQLESVIQNMNVECLKRAYIFGLRKLLCFHMLSQSPMPASAFLLLCTNA